MRPLRIILFAGILTSVLGFSAFSAPQTARAEGAQLIAQTKPQAQPNGGSQNGQNTKGDNIDPITGKPVKDSSVVNYISDAYFWASIIGGLLAVLMMMYAGYSYMTSAGDPEKISNSKDIVEKALLGLGLLILAAVILKTINPATVDPNACKPNCGSIDFTKPNGGVPQP